MKITRNLTQSSWGIGLAALLLATAGCDDDADTSSADNYVYGTSSSSSSKSTSLSISPASDTVTFPGQQFTFQAKGGTSPYTWGVGNTSRGTVTPGGTGNSYGVYTANQVGPNTVIVYDAAHRSAVATLAGTEISITISPDAILNKNGDKVSLKVTGGVAPYHWFVTDITRGQIITGGSSSTEVYERYNSGDNAVRVTDARGNIANAVIKQP